MSSFESEVSETAKWFDSPRFAGTTRLYSARQVVEQRGTIRADYTVARVAAEQFYDRLRQLFAERRPITTFGPYSSGQASGSEKNRKSPRNCGRWSRPTLPIRE